MIIKLDMNSEIALYEQLYNNIIWGIATGKLKPGERMPTVRKLGIDLGINLHTVNKAYAILKQKGYLSSHRNKGAVVNDKQFYPANMEFREEIKSSLIPLVSECYTRGMDEQGINEFISDIIQSINDEVEDRD